MEIEVITVPRYEVGDTLEYENNTYIIDDIKYIDHKKSLLILSAAPEIKRSAIERKWYEFWFLVYYPLMERLKNKWKRKRNC